MGLFENYSTIKVLFDSFSATFVHFNFGFSMVVCCILGIGTFFLFFYFSNATLTTYVYHIHIPPYVTDNVYNHIN